MQCRLRDRRSRLFSLGLRPCPLRNEIPPDSLNLLIMLCTVEGEISKSLPIFLWGTLFLNISIIFSRICWQTGDPQPIFAPKGLDLSWMLYIYTVYIYCIFKLSRSAWWSLHIHSSQVNTRHNKSISTISTDIPLSLPLLLLAPSLFSSSPLLFSLMNFWCCMFLSGVLGSCSSVVWRRLGQDGRPAVVYFYPSLGKWEAVPGRGAGLWLALWFSGIAWWQCPRG